MTGPTETDLAMMRRCLDLAAGAAAAGEVPVGAVVYDHATGEVLGEGANRRETDHRPTGHAEILAIEAAAQHLGDWRLEGLSIAVTLEPCPMCAGAIVNARLDRVIYGAADPKAGAAGTLMDLTRDERLNHRAREVIAGVLGDECSRMLKDFFARLRKGGGGG